MKKIIALVLTFVMVLSMSVSALSFTDVTEDYWGYDYINQMSESGVVNGYPEGDFRPENAVTYAEFAKMLSILSGVIVDENGETATEEEWYEKYMTAAESFFSFAGVEFDPNADASREDVASSIVIALGLEAGDATTLADKFSDASDIDAIKAPYVAAAVNEKIINGYPEGTFMPKATITRAEVCAMLSRAFAEDEKPGVTVTPAGKDEGEKEEIFYEYSISTDKTEYSAGETVYLTVTLNSTESAMGSQFVINYDPALFDIVVEDDNYTNEEWLEEYYNYPAEAFLGVLHPYANPEKGKISIIELRRDGKAITPENAVENMEVFKMNLTVKEGVSGEAKFSLEGTYVASQIKSDVAGIANDVTVTIK